MVKEYARSSADQDTPLPHDLRPVPVLQRTMAHLCKNISDRCEDTDELIDDWYMFMWDRTRAIRKVSNLCFIKPFDPIPIIINNLALCIKSPLGAQELRRDDGRHVRQTTSVLPPRFKSFYLRP